LLLIGIPLEGNPFHFHWTRMALISLFYLAIVGSVAAFLLYYWLVQHMDVTKTMLVALVTPVIAVTLGVVALNEELNWRTFAGGGMIISGIGLVVLRKSKSTEVPLG
jgi:drug/metabolite transporter (DMT)-like permease